MSYSLDLDNWLVSNRYIHPDTRKFGTLYSLTDDYNIYVQVTVKARIAGRTVSKKTKTYFVGTVKSFKVKRTENIIKNKSSSVYTNGSGGYFEEALEEKLGGSNSVLGA